LDESSKKLLQGMIDTLAKVNQHFASKGNEMRSEDFNQTNNSIQPPGP